MRVPESKDLVEAKQNLRLSQHIQDQQAAALARYTDLWGKAYQLVMSIAYGTIYWPTMRDVGGGVRIVFGPPEYEHVLFLEAEGEEYMVYYTVIRGQDIEKGTSFLFGREDRYAAVRSRLLTGVS